MIINVMYAMLVTVLLRNSMVHAVVEQFYTAL